MDRSSADGACVSDSVVEGSASYPGGNSGGYLPPRKLALAVAGVGVWEFQAGQGRFTLDDTERQLRGLGSNATGHLLLETVLSTIVIEDRERIRDALQAAVAQGSRFDELYRVQITGETRWLHSIGHTSASDVNAPLVGISFDAGAEGEALAARDLLLREMNHRIKNLFAVIGGMVSLCAREAESPRELAEDLGNRIAAMGRAHALTQHTMVDHAFELRDLIEAVIEPTRTRQKIMIKGEPLAMPVALVTPLALIFHEWATNAAKYGALADPEGALSVRWSVDGAGLTTIEWKEACAPVADRSVGQPGFGTRLIEATVAQLRAHLTGEQGSGSLTRRLTVAGLG